MSTHTIDLVSSSIPSESPIKAEEVKNILAGAIKEHEESEKFISALLSALSKKTSKYKLLAQIINIDAKDGKDIDMNANSSFGAMWDQERDGLVSFRVESATPVSSNEDQEDSERENDPKDDSEEVDDDAKNEDVPVIEKEPVTEIAKVVLVCVFWVYVG